MLKSKVSINSTQHLRKSLTSVLNQGRCAVVGLPCPSHPNYPISHVCLNAVCT